MKSLRALLVASSLLVLSASTLSAQAGQVACKDGSKSAGGRGACSGHGGIAPATAKSAAKADVKMNKAMAKTASAEKKADARADKMAAKAETRPMKAEAKAATKADKMVGKSSADDRDARGATAECKDHTYSHAKNHQGACSTHGGVAKFIGGK